MTTTPFSDAQLDERISKLEMSMRPTNASAWEPRRLRLLQDALIKGRVGLHGAHELVNALLRPLGLVQLLRQAVLLHLSVTVC